jgi:hypothetical protein
LWTACLSSAGCTARAHGYGSERVVPTDRAHACTHVIAAGVDCRTHAHTRGQVRGRGLDAHRLWLSLSRCRLAFWHGKRHHL